MRKDVSAPVKWIAIAVVSPFEKDVYVDAAVCSTLKAQRCDVRPNSKGSFDDVYCLGSRYVIRVV